MGSWKQWSRAALTAAALAVVLDLLGAGRIQVTAYALSCPGLPEAFSGLKIALITDLHGAFLEDGGQRKTISEAPKYFKRRKNAAIAGSPVAVGELFRFCRRFF